MVVNSCLIIFLNDIKQIFLFISNYLVVMHELKNIFYEFNVNILCFSYENYTHSKNKNKN